ncbi:ABC transporter permease subunit [Devosia sp.]|uniref:ABC transporter permease n=1 Tax=Devosia sp. TaxID=1871048 RepID=UPI001ACEF5F5|nr:ABC transporter permease subunit [Devosia sp.]MBN9334445.1 ABC transporter permease subunit [Devosia sp.]
MLRHFRLAWLGLVPFLVFITAFELLPLGGLVLSAFSDGGGPSVVNFVRAARPAIVTAFANSTGLSLATALLGTAVGLVIAYLVQTSRSRRWRNVVTALSTVTASFGGAPLAFAFIIALGSTGMITMLLGLVGIDLYPGFRIYSVTGLIVAYLYFQIPLAVLLLLPSVQGLKREWREAATSLGADGRAYWLRVGLPLLRPSIASCFCLLFANAFGAYATAWTLTGSSVELVTVQIAALIRGEVQLDPALADAIAVLSMLVMAAAIWLQRLFARRQGMASR